VKRCKKCERDLPVISFGSTGGIYKRNVCNSCRTTSKKPSTRKKINDARRRSKHQDRIDAIAAYGGKCFCCGETELVFLVLDHVNGGGRKHRASISYNMYTWAKRNNYPDILRIACHNCNFAIFKNGGFCPHQSVVGSNPIA
jgi:hypothetical protein